MGYTHYWKLKSNNADLFSDAVSLFQGMSFLDAENHVRKKMVRRKGCLG